MKARARAAGSAGSGGTIAASSSGFSATVAATVSVVESLGHEQHVICRLDDGQLVIVRQPSAVTSPTDGSQVRLAADPGHVHLFDAESEQRVAA